ncbi:unnamed protein product [Auanema sp. JU1783]|nr:unnamed protein product [Auanema sp. JU1783]
MLKRKSEGGTIGLSNKPTPSPKLHVQFRSPIVKEKENEEKNGRRKRKAKEFVCPFEASREELMDPLRFKHVRIITETWFKESESHDAIITKLLSKAFVLPVSGYAYSGRALGLGKSKVRVALFDPYAENAVVLFVPPPMTAHEELHAKKEDKLVHVVVDPVVGGILRPHQRDGVKFMYDCVTGVNIQDFHGCIMADEMGLGKTLQCITLLWTLIRQSPECKPTCSKIVIVCPSSLVKNWDKEIKKWLGSRLNVLAMDGGKKEDIIKSLTAYMADARIRAGSPVLVISYETFRLYADILHSSNIGMVICDEGHRLKNSDNLTYQALSGMKCVRRVLISGTPIQNDLLEYYSLVNFVNPGLLGSAQEFKKRFENPILRGRDGSATDVQQKLGEEKTKEMVSLVEKCIIRRTSALLTKYLPLKYEFIICCKNTELQDQLYNKLIEIEKRLRSKENKERDSEGGASALSFITHLKKLCNHPYLIYEEVQKDTNRFKETRSMFPSSFGTKKCDPVFSGKMKVLDYILAVTRKTTTDKFVLISNYTQTMDQFVELCRLRGYGYVRLDGSMSIKKRGQIVDRFNDPESTEFCFLLSSKAGGCGLNLIGANRLVMFDPDWNPANDDQAMARVWRDGQKKTCFIYRLLSTGSIEEKMFQRQTHKKALSSCIIDAGEDVARHFSSDQLKELFKLESNVASDTHERLKCKRCINGVESIDPPEDTDCSADLSLWHHSQKDPRKLPDPVLRSVFDCGALSFVFHQKSHKVEVQKAMEKEKKLKERAAKEDPEYNPEEEEDE